MSRLDVMLKRGAEVSLRIRAGLFVLALSAGFANSSMGPDVGHRARLAHQALSVITDLTVAYLLLLGTRSQ